MSKAIRIHTTGGPEVLKWEQLPTPRPGPSEALIQHEAVGLNYIDVYFRTGFYKPPAPHHRHGRCGNVLSIGDNVTGLSVGDRVAYAGGPSRPMPRCVPSWPTGEQTPPEIELQNRSCHDARRHSPRNSLALHLQSAAGPDHSAACRRRRRAYIMYNGPNISAPMSSAWSPPRRKPRWPKPTAPPTPSSATPILRRMSKINRRRHGSGGVRQHRQGHFRPQPGLPRPARADGQFRRCLRRGPAL